MKEAGMRTLRKMARRAPQHWKAEFGSAYRIPATLDILASKGVIEDMSWHNDVNPSFGKITCRKYEVRLWIEHPDPRQRNEGAKRYAVSVGDSEAGPDSPEPTGRERNGIETDSFSRALRLLFEKIKKYS